MATNEIDDQNEEEKAVAAEAAKAAEAAPEQTVKYATYDKAMNTAAKRKQENDELRQQIADLEKGKLENTKNTDTGKYVETLESSVDLIKQQLVDLQSKYDTDMANRDEADKTRTKLSAFWDVARKEGMVDDRDFLNFVDQSVIQLDENGVVNIKSVNAEINRIKASKPYAFAEPAPERINDRPPKSGDETDTSKLSFSEQLRLKQT